MLRQRLNENLKTAMLEDRKQSVGTIRLILAAVKDRDIAARSDGNNEGIDDTQILSLLQSMIKQRHESITMYEQGGRAELAERERAEIGIIADFLPKQLQAPVALALRNQSWRVVGASGPSGIRRE